MVASSVRTYLIAHACFDCRKSFKLAPRSNYAATCPNCGGVILEMGRSFKAPPARDIAQWSKIRELFAAGFRFSSYRSTSGPPLPRKLSEVKAFIGDNPAHPMKIPSRRRPPME